MGGQKIRPVTEPGGPLAGNALTGYILAGLNMVVSGIAIYVNSLGVRMFSDSTLYTAGKNLVAGATLAVVLAFSAGRRRSLGKLTRRGWMLLLFVALIGGSVPYALYFRGLELSTPVTASLIDHTQFLFVALFAAVFLQERLGASVWTALVVLLAGLMIGIAANSARLDSGVPFIVGATLLFAVDFILMKVLLRTVAPLTVMTFKMGLGSLLLLLFVIVTGRGWMMARLSALQVGFLVVTGLILVAFTATSVLGLRLASATAVTAIAAGSPIITTALVAVSQKVEIPASRWLGFSLALLSVLAVFIIGSRRESRAGTPTQEGTT